MKNFLILLSIICLCGCAERKTADFFAMDTVISLDIYGNSAEDTIAKMEEEIKRIDKKFAPGSEIVEDSESIYLINTSKLVSQATDGAFNAELGKVISLWNFTSEKPKVPSKSEIKKALSVKEYNFGGIAKGYATDRLKYIAKENGITSGILSLGGNVYAIGKKSDQTQWQIGICDPRDTSSYIGYVIAEDQAIVTSGGYQRNFKKDGKIYHHILNPKTGYPADSDLISVTIISESGIFADALSTAIFVGGKELLDELYSKRNVIFEAVVVEKNGNIITTDNAPFFRKE